MINLSDNLFCYPIFNRVAFRAARNAVPFKIAKTIVYSINSVIFNSTKAIFRFEKLICWCFAIKTIFYYCFIKKFFCYFKNNPPFQGIGFIPIKKPIYSIFSRIKAIVSISCICLNSHFFPKASTRLRSIFRTNRHCAYSDGSFFSTITITIKKVLSSTILMREGGYYKSAVSFPDIFLYSRFSNHLTTINYNNLINKLFLKG